jgi:hypothetical protein
MILQANHCPNCGASVLFTSPNNDIAICEYCHSSFRVASSFTPQPDLGDLLLGADFSQLPPAGWQLLNEQATSRGVHPQGIPELVGRFDASEQVHYVLQSSGIFDDFDVSVNIHCIDGELKYSRGGLVVRYNSTLGGYIIFVSVQSTYMIGWYERKDEKLVWGGELIDWTTHHALRSGFGVTNRLRVLMRGNQMRLYLNGVLACSLRDDRHHSGQIRLGIEPSKHGPITFGFSDLQLREVSNT